MASDDVIKDALSFYFALKCPRTIFTSYRRHLLKLRVGRFGVTVFPLRLLVFLIITIACAAGAKKRIHLEHGPKIPKEIVPLNYDLLLKVDGAKKSHSGKVKITFNLAGEISYIPIHVRDLAITGVQLTKWPEPEHILNEATYFVKKHELLVLKYPENLQIGRYDLVVSFDSPFSESLAGLHKSSYHDPARDIDKWYVVSNFWPTFARRAFPCFDELHLRATFELTIQHPTLPGYKAMSNGDIEEITVNNEITTTVFEKTEPMSPNMLNIFISDFTYIPIVVHVDDDAYEIRLHTIKAQAANLDYAADAIKLIFENLSDYFESPYPLLKLDIVAIPGFKPNHGSGAGLIMLRDTEVIYNPEIDTVHDMERIAKALSNQITHLLFDTPLKLTSWSDIWLSDSLAAFMEHRILQDTYPFSDYEYEVIIDKQLPALDVDASSVSRPIVLPVDKLNDIYALQDDLIWKKGASVLFMLEYVVGLDVMRSAIVSFLKKGPSQKQATVDDFFLEVTRAGAHFDVAGTMSTWIHQMGYPVVKPITLDSKIFQITQHRFLLNNQYNYTDLEDSMYQYKWNVPTTYFPSHNIDIYREAVRQVDGSPRIPSGRKLYSDTFSLDKNVPQFTLSLPTEVKWVKFNREGAGFYRVNYPLPMWDTFARVLDKNYKILAEGDRANLISDAFALAEAGEVPYEVPMELIKYMADEPSAIVWDTVTKALARLVRLMKYQDAVYLIKFGQKLVDKVYNRLHLEQGGPMRQQLRRAAIAKYACMHLNAKCLENVKDSFIEWFEDTKNLPPTHLREFIYYNGLRMEGDEKVWKKIWDSFTRSNDPNERQRFLTALSSTTNVGRLRKLMSLAEQEIYVPKQDFLPFLGSVAEANPHIVWAYLKKNWPKLVARFGIEEIALAKLVVKVTKYFANEELLGNLEKFYQTFPDAGPYSLLREQSIENVKNNIRWLRDGAPKLVEYLKSDEFLDDSHELD